MVAPMMDWTDRHDRRRIYPNLLFNRSQYFTGLAGPVAVDTGLDTPWCSR